LMKKTLMPSISEKQELALARISAAIAIGVAGVFGIYPPAFVAQVVAFAFGLAAASIFPAIVMGIFSKRMNSVGAITGMIAGLVFTACYIIFFKFVSPELNNPDNWFLGISPEGIGVIGMIVNFSVSIIFSSLTKAPPIEVVELVDNIRLPGGGND